LTADADATPRWRVDRPHDLVWATLDEGAAVYHRPSGKTHFLNAGSVAMLERLRARAATADELALVLAGGEISAVTPEFVGHIAVTLQYFSELGLIQPCPS
jgi:PqqD family protein of HPr-rel-A system